MVTQIRVARGIYTPDDGADYSPGDRRATFHLISGVTIEGGYAGSKGTDPDEHSVIAYETILSGDLYGDDEPDFENMDENSYHVVTGVDVDESAVLSGLTIVAGNADGLFADRDNWGGGMYNYSADPILINCRFTSNAAERGAGLCNYYASPTVTECSFTDNWASSGGGMYNNSGHPDISDCTFTGNYGGAMRNSDSNPTLTDCMFTDNWGVGMINLFSRPSIVDSVFNNNRSYFGSYGRGMVNYYGHPTMSNCSLRGNESRGSGGGMSNYYSSPMLIDCTIADNSAGGDGGGMYNEQFSAPVLTNTVVTGNTCRGDGGGFLSDHSALTLTNCTLHGNSAENGRTIACDSKYQDWPSDIELENCILFNGGSEVWNNDYSTITITYSTVQDEDPNDGIVFPGWGNIDDDPLFVPGPAGSYYLSQVAGGQSVDSPCLDAGSDSPEVLELAEMTTRSDEETDVYIVDMGYHYAVTERPLVMGDFDRSGVIDLADFAGLQTCFSGEGPSSLSPDCRIFDFEPDMDADLQDFAIFETLLTDSR